MRVDDVFLATSARPCSPVGSGALPLRAAVVLGGAMEWLGAVSLGAGVAKTIKGTTSIHDPSCWACGYCDSTMVGRCRLPGSLESAYGFSE